MPCQRILLILRSLFVRKKSSQTSSSPDVDIEKERDAPDQLTMHIGSWVARASCPCLDKPGDQNDKMATFGDDCGNSGP
jgi:hypothetical protein